MLERIILSDNREPDVDQIIEEHERMLYEEHKESEVNDLTNYFKSTYDVKEQTVKEHRNAIYEAKELADIHWDYYEALDKTGCDTLSLVLYELNEDFRASIFLSMHGLYRPANSLLRRWLDTTIYALYIDSEFKKGANKNEIEKYCNEWLTGHKPKDSFKGILEKVLKDTLMNKVDINGETFINIINNIFKDLSQCVHYGGILAPEDLKINFVEYNKEHFEDWFKKLNQINEICYILILSKFPNLASQNGSISNLVEKRIKNLKKWN